jgi:hypothetical protein
MTAEGTVGAPTCFYYIRLRAPPCGSDQMHVWLTLFELCECDGHAPSSWDHVQRPLRILLFDVTGSRENVAFVREARKTLSARHKDYVVDTGNEAEAAGDTTRRLNIPALAASGDPSPSDKYLTAASQACEIIFDDVGLGQWLNETRHVMDDRHLHTYLHICMTAYLI